MRRNLTHHRTTLLAMGPVHSLLVELDLRDRHLVHVLGVGRLELVVYLQPRRRDPLNQQPLEVLD